MFSLKQYIHGDRVIWTVVIFLSIFSILAVYSSTGTIAYRFKAGDTEYYLLKQFRLLLTGFGLMYLAHLVKFNYYSRLAQLALYLSVPLLIITLIFGSNINEATRWLTLPIGGISFQTSDFAKLALTMYIARALTKNQENIKDFKTGFLPVVVPVLAICGLILPSNFSTAGILLVSCMMLMFIGRIKIKYLLTLVGVFVIFIGLFISIAFLVGKKGRIATWEKRIENFYHGAPEGNYQVNQAKIAIATGGFLGKGPGNSTQRNFLPQPYSDFIFAIIIEEYGIAGGIFILLLYMILLFRCIRLVTRHPSTFAAFLATGCSIQLILQALVNMAVAVNLMPVTGQSLPLVSMGGTSILFTSIAIGIILSVSRALEESKESVVPVNTEINKP